MTPSIGQALGLHGPRAATSCFATQEAPGSRPGFEREFERAIVDTWFAGGPLERRTPAPTRDPAPPTADPDAGGGGRAADDLRRGPSSAPRPGAPSNAAGANPTSRADAPSPGSAAPPCGPAAATAWRPPCAGSAPQAVAPTGSGTEALPPVATVATTGASARVPVHPPATPPSPEPGTAADPHAVPADPRPAAPPATPIRLHVEADATGAARVWLGVDAAARTAAADAVERVRDALVRSGLRVRGVVVNGSPVADAAPASLARRDT